MWPMHGHTVSVNGSPHCLVTGAAGFIGSNLARSMLARGYAVTGIDCFDPHYDRRLKEANVASLEAAGMRFVEGDVRDRDTVEAIFHEDRPEVVVHLAARPGVRSSLLDPGACFSINVGGTTSILDACRRLGCDQVILASSSSVYGESDRVPFAEADPAVAPVSPYAASKRCAELITETYARTSGLRVGCLRFFTVYGPGQRPDLAIHRFMRCLLNEDPIPMFGDGSTSRDYTYVDDIVNGVLSAIRVVGIMPPGSFRTWNLGSDHPVALGDLIRMLGELAGRRPIIDHQPEQTGDVSRTWADLTRSRDELAYAPSVSMEQGLARQWEWVAGQVVR